MFQYWILIMYHETSISALCLYIVKNRKYVLMRWKLYSFVVYIFYIYMYLCIILYIFVLYLLISFFQKHIKILSTLQYITDQCNRNSSLKCLITVYILFISVIF